MGFKSKPVLNAVRRIAEEICQRDSWPDFSVKNNGHTSVRPTHKGFQAEVLKDRNGDDIEIKLGKKRSGRLGDTDFFVSVQANGDFRFHLPGVAAERVLKTGKQILKLVKKDLNLA